jgi:hypothetical protein
MSLRVESVRVTPRYGRISALVTSCLVTLVAVTGGIGLLQDEPGSTPQADAPEEISLAGTTSRADDTVEPAALPPETVAVDPKALPPDSGTGRRVVFDQSGQRVWLVNDAGQVLRTYLVSGSLTDNLRPGTYSVFSRSRWAVGVDDTGVMQYFVRFAHGETAAIGFHTIPTKNGDALQTRAQLGTPQSHGCIRQDEPDAIALWRFSPVGTTVVVTA